MLLGKKLRCVCNRGFYEFQKRYKTVDSDRNYVSGTSSKSGNKAIGHGELNRKLLFITVETKKCDVVLSCDNNGNLS